MAVLYRSKRVLLDDGLQEAGILVENGKISRILRKNDTESVGENVQVKDVGNLVIMPGLVDSHVHINEPGRSDWEGFWTATRAAAAGGITTVVDMPLNSIPPTTTKENFHEKMKASNGKLHVDVAFWGGVIPGNQSQIQELIKEGVVGFKCFLCPSGVDEFPSVTKSDIEASLKQLQGTKSVMAFHAECEVKQESLNVKESPNEYETYLRTRSPKMEVAAVKMITELCEQYRVPCHIVHLSASEALYLVNQAKLKGLPLTAETCHHYLTLHAEMIPNGATQFKCCPPIRGLQNKERLWSAVAAEQLDMVVSDHSPSVPTLKRFDDGNFLEAWGGISSLQFGLSLFWTEAQKRGFSLADVSRLLSGNPAKLCGLDGVKGSLKEGMDADIVIWDPEASFKIEESIMEFKNKVTPYLGMELSGKVSSTIVRGNCVFEDKIGFSEPAGKIIFRCVN